MLDRLVGLETEYAIRFHPDDPMRDDIVDYQLFHALMHTLGQRIGFVPAHDMKEGVFLETGGAVWFERVRFAGGFGLVEGSTPECRGPREAVLHQRAQDLLLSEAARDAEAPGELALLKNDCDSQGHIYGAQENYEVTMVSGWWLRLWQCGLIALFPLMLIAWLGYLFLFLAMKVYVWFAATFGDDPSTRTTYFSPVPEWVESAGLGWMRITGGPLALGLYLLVRLTAFRQIHRELLPFLISRPIIGGAGFVDEEGRFQLSDKSWGMNCLLGFNGIVYDRPIFSIGHLFKALMFRAWTSPKEFGRLLKAKQRLQICLGDSNMAEEAEYLRVGTTMLVLDALEAGYLSDVPQVRQPIKALKILCADPTLEAQVQCKDGQQRSALEIQRYYYHACEKFVKDAEFPKEEALDLLHRWEEALTLLETNPEELVGRVDWVTKRFLLTQTTEEADDLAIKKKVDLRYHELSNEGYYQQLKTTGVTQAVFVPEDIERATKMPPANTPATLRCFYISELLQSTEPYRVSWQTVTVGKGSSKITIDLTDPNAVPKPMH